MEYKIDAAGKDLRNLSSEIRKALQNGISKIIIENASQIHGIASGLKDGEIIINGDVGDYAATLNDGAFITINGSAGKYLADNMTKGLVIVNGDADYGCGVYCYGGEIVVKGNAGDFLGALNKGATIIVSGDVGDYVGIYMVGGEIIIIGSVGENIGDWFIRGTIFIGGEYESVGHNCKEVSIENEDIKKLRQYFNKFNINADPRRFRKLVPISARPFYGR